jgi:hypothetical protein
MDRIGVYDAKSSCTWQVSALVVVYRQAVAEIFIKVPWDFRRPRFELFVKD